jgi:hypothetical protein
MTKQPKILALVSLIPLAQACIFTGSNGEKRACEKPTDCLDGYSCINNICIDPGGGDDMKPDGGKISTGSDAAPDVVPQYGDATAFTAQSAGHWISTSGDLVGLANAAGGLGCSLVNNEEASPGTSAAAVHIKIDGDTSYCPTGSYSILGPSDCDTYDFGELARGCALYKEWDSSGTQIASRLAIGGYVQVSKISETGACEFDVGVNFAGGVTVTQVFEGAPAGNDFGFCAQ